jgi:hypothetical protein
MNIASVAANAYGDSTSWAAVTSNSLVLQPGTYRIQWNALVEALTVPCDLHWSVTTDAFALVKESGVTNELGLATAGNHATIVSAFQIDVAEETAYKFHIGAENGTAKLYKGEFGQILVYKVA